MELYNSEIDLIVVNEKLRLFEKKSKPSSGKNLLSNGLSMVFVQWPPAFGRQSGSGQDHNSKMHCKDDRQWFFRIQFTPDLMPADILGSYIF